MSWLSTLRKRSEPAGNVLIIEKQSLMFELLKKRKYFWARNKSKRVSADPVSADPHCDALCGSAGWPLASVVFSLFTLTNLLLQFRLLTSKSALSTSTPPHCSSGTKTPWQLCLDRCKVQAGALLSTSPHAFGMPRATKKIGPVVCSHLQRGWQNGVWTTKWWDASQKKGRLGDGHLFWPPDHVQK